MCLKSGANSGREEETVEDRLSHGDVGQLEFA
jgi:hypothetical protein